MNLIEKFISFKILNILKDFLIIYHRFRKNENIEKLNKIINNDLSFNEIILKTSKNLDDDNTLYSFKYNLLSNYDKIFQNINFYDEIEEHYFFDKLNFELTKLILFYHSKLYINFYKSINTILGIFQNYIDFIKRYKHPKYRISSYFEYNTDLQNFFIQNFLMNLNLKQVYKKYKEKFEINFDNSIYAEKIYTIHNLLLKNFSSDFKKDYKKFDDIVKNLSKIDLEVESSYKKISKYLEQIMNFNFLIFYNNILYNFFNKQNFNIEEIHKKVQKIKEYNLKVLNKTLDKISDKYYLNSMNKEKNEYYIKKLENLEDYLKRFKKNFLLDRELNRLLINLSNFLNVNSNFLFIQYIKDKNFMNSNILLKYPKNIDQIYEMILYNNIICKKLLFLSNDYKKDLMRYFEEYIDENNLFRIYLLTFYVIFNKIDQATHLFKDLITSFFISTRNIDLNNKYILDIEEEILKGILETVFYHTNNEKTYLDRFKNVIGISCRELFLEKNVILCAKIIGFIFKFNLFPEFINNLIIDFNKKYYDTIRLLSMKKENYKLVEEILKGLEIIAYYTKNYDVYNNGKNLIGDIWIEKKFNERIKEMKKVKNNEQ